MLKKASVSIFALVASSSLAAAADLNGASHGGSLKDDFAAPAAHSWTGFYFGANGGYVWGDITFAKDLAFEPEGWVAGGQIGANYQIGQIVLGVEADYQRADAEDGVHGVSIDSRINNFATVRGRLGFDLGRAMPYLTAGYGWVDAEVEISALNQSAKLSVDHGGGSMVVASNSHSGRI